MAAESPVPVAGGAPAAEVFAASRSHLNRRQRFFDVQTEPEEIVPENFSTIWDITVRVARQQAPGPAV